MKIEDILSENIEAIIFVIGIGIIWMLGYEVMKKTFSLQRTEVHASCECGSGAPQFPGRRTHYTQDEFKKRFLRKYKRSMLKVRVEGAERAVAKAEAIPMVEENLPRLKKATKQAQKCVQSAREESIRIASKTVRKWMLCSKCWNIGRRSYVSPELQDVLCFNKVHTAINPEGSAFYFMAQESLMEE